MPQIPSLLNEDTLEKRQQLCCGGSYSPLPEASKRYWIVEQNVQQLFELILGIVDYKRDFMNSLQEGARSRFMEIFTRKKEYLNYCMVSAGIALLMNTGIKQCNVPRRGSFRTRKHFPLEISTIRSTE